MIARIVTWAVEKRWLVLLLTVIERGVVDDAERKLLHG